MGEGGRDEEGGGLLVVGLRDHVGIVSISYRL